MPDRWTHDPLKLLELLDDFQSAETLRARRRLSTFSFIVVLVILLEVPIERLSIAGVPILRGYEQTITWISLALLLYWLVVFLLRFFTDRGRDAERDRIAKDAISEARVRQDALQQRLDVTSNHPHYQPEFDEIGRFLSAAENQANRTKATRIGVFVMRILEWLPTLVLAILALVLLSLRLVALSTQA